MMIRLRKQDSGPTRTALVYLFLFFLMMGSVPALTQTRLSPGFNLFSEQDDIEIGRQSAVEVEQQMPPLRAPRVEAYVQRIGGRLAAVIQGPKYPYQFKILDDPEVNAFALPGGFMYLNRGLIEAADNEGQLAGVMAHEMAHVALRHGTNQASKAYLAEAGLGVLGGVLGGGTGDIIGAVGGFGLNTLFLKFSRSAEGKADLLGAQTLAKAGYDPIDMVTFFEKLGQLSPGGHSKAEQFFSSHPAPENRAARVRQEINLLGPIRKRGDEGNLREIQARLGRAPSSPAPNPPARGRDDRPETIPLPSSGLQTYSQANGFLRIQYPDNWQAFGDPSGVGVTFLPPGGMVERNGRQEIIEGVIVNHYLPFDDEPQSSHGARTNDPLREATEDLIHQLLRSNSYLEVEESTWRKDRIAGGEADSVVLSGISPVTRSQEQVTVFTRQLADGHILYLVFIADVSRYRELGGAFERMLSSLQVDDRRGHQD